MNTSNSNAYRPATPLTLTVMVDEPSLVSLMHRLAAEFSQGIRINVPPERNIAPMVPAAKTAATGEPLLWSSPEVAKALRISERTVWAMWHSGQMPQPLRLGRTIRWSAETIKEWIAAGCPAETDRR